VCLSKLDFVHRESINGLWFAIGRYHVSDRLPRPHYQRRDATRGRGRFSDSR